MDNLETSKKWADDETIIHDIKSVAFQLKKAVIKIRHNQYGQNEFSDLPANIIEILKTWTGSTYIGVRKSKQLEDAFQMFFLNLLEYTLEIKRKDKNHPICKTLYQGYIYRILGSNNPKNKEIIKPRYSNVFVSWSKNENIPTNNMLEKLYGPITKLKSKIYGEQYGIDLTVSGISNIGEQEIVFPTLKKYTEIQKIIKH